jgi:hypothetical protein
MSPSIRFLRLHRPNVIPSLSRRWISANLNRPSPPPLPREQQREFEKLLRKTQNPGTAETETPGMHPDAREPLTAEFHGDINPITGEKGGPKREPVGRWGEDPGGDWSFKGRVSDF